jgi:EAL domain-containing protein (putative c-di-GMP-specific phosphodiesterase class I)
LGRWVLEEACRQAAVWNQMRDADSPLRMAVNVAARQLARHDLAEQVAEALGAAGLPAARLRLEITESAVMSDRALASATLTACRALGVQVALDDFGTGYSSLSYLTRFPVDVVKIDRSFVQQLPTDRGAAAVVRAVLATAKALHLEVVVEGVETGAQLRRLRRLGCRSGQGFLFAKPLPAPALTELLTQGGSGATAA